MPIDKITEKEARKLRAWKKWGEMMKLARELLEQAHAQIVNRERMLEN